MMLTQGSDTEPCSPANRPGREGLRGATLHYQYWFTQYYPGGCQEGCGPGRQLFPCPASSQVAPLGVNIQPALPVSPQGYSGRPTAPEASPPDAHEQTGRPQNQQNHTRHTHCARSTENLPCLDKVWGGAAPQAPGKAVAGLLSLSCPWGQSQQNQPCGAGTCSVGLCPGPINRPQWHIPRPLSL